MGAFQLSGDVTVESHGVASNFFHLYGARNVTFVQLEGDQATALLILRQQTGIFIARIPASLSAWRSSPGQMRWSPTGPSPLCLRMESKYEVLPIKIGRNLSTSSDLWASIPSSWRPSRKFWAVAEWWLETPPSWALLPWPSGVILLGALTQGTHFFHWPRPARIPLTFSVKGGLGFLKNYVLDSQVSELGREGRPLRLTQMPLIGSPKGLGESKSRPRRVQSAHWASWNGKNQFKGEKIMQSDSILIFMWWLVRMLWVVWLLSMSPICRLFPSPRESTSSVFFLHQSRLTSGGWLAVSSTRIIRKTRT